MDNNSLTPNQRTRKLFYLISLFCPIINSIATIVGIILIVVFQNVSADVFYLIFLILLVSLLIIYLPMMFLIFIYYKQVGQPNESGHMVVGILLIIFGVVIAGIFVLLAYFNFINDSN